MSTPEQPASDAGKPSEQALKAAFEIYKLRWSAELTVLQTGRVIDRETKLPELQAQLAAQQAALLAAKDALVQLIQAEQASINELGYREIFGISAAITNANAVLAQIRPLLDK